jgi:chemotaxis regulatin CheY-phosphate phosphatase CheZ
MSTNTTSSNQSCSTTVEVPKNEYNQLLETVERLESELQETRKEQAQDRQRIHELEERLDDVEDEESTTETPTPDGEKDDSTGTQTPLEQICSLPEEAVVSQLSANQRRARFVARDVEQYASKVPAGYSITSGEISTVLRAGTDCDGRTQTVARVMDFLDRLGRDAVKIVKRRGTKRIVFDEEIVEKLGEIEDQGDNTGCYDTVGVGAL